MAGISSLLSRDEDLSDSVSSSVKRSELESSDSDSQSELFDEDMTHKKKDEIVACDKVKGASSVKGIRRYLRGIISRRVTNNVNVPASSSSDVKYCEWSMKNFNPLVISRIEPSYLPIDADSFTDKFDYFKLSIDDELMKLIVLKTNQSFLA
ncbi:unnamed protein product [Parnassius apollo]|uniref:(apollo) hypothetical protein n=1 Tax=Parnassius apollo TaxID=110799 RepID=A0A8S3WKL0_PARAO|nr:unnamed protein product [Parnassius apollo]